jgi:hypothetical protein
MAEVIQPQHSDKPVILLDIDGVLRLASNGPDSFPDGYEGDARYRGIFGINPSHGDWIRKHQTHADFYYLTIHREHASQVIGEALQLPEFDWVPFDPRANRKPKPGEPYWRGVAASYFFPERPIAILDDEAGEQGRQWAEARVQTEAPTLLITPDRHKGLESAHIRQVEHWLGSVAAQSSI